MKIRGMKEIRKWADDTGREIVKAPEGKPSRFILRTRGNDSRAMTRPVFRRACSKIMKSEEVTTCPK